MEVHRADRWMLAFFLLLRTCRFLRWLDLVLHREPPANSLSLWSKRASRYLQVLHSRRKHWDRRNDMQSPPLCGLDGLDGLDIAYKLGPGVSDPGGGKQLEMTKARRLWRGSTGSILHTPYWGSHSLCSFLSVVSKSFWQWRRAPLPSLPKLVPSEPLTEEDDVSDADHIRYYIPSVSG